MLGHRILLAGSFTCSTHPCRSISATKIEAVTNSSGFPTRHVTFLIEELYYRKHGLAPVEYVIGLP